MSNTEHPALVEFMTAKTPIEAQIIAGVLADAGIPTYVPGGQLTDEFAVSQQVLGLLSVIIRVRGSDVERARQAIAAARELGSEITEDEQASDGEQGE
ncbi:MAG: hypothetical protein ACI9EF_001814 [Pseudohongiellaceae bacterium]|jgi:hypothetical protein